MGRENSKNRIEGTVNGEIKLLQNRSKTAFEVKRRLYTTGKVEKIPFFGWSLIYRKLKSLIITYSNSNRSTCDYGEKRNSGDRGTVGTEERKAQRNTGHRGTVSAEKQ